MAGRSQEQHLKSNGVSVVVRTPPDWGGETAVILAHGAGQDMNSSFMSFFHEGLADLGHLSVKFNFPYMETGRRAPDHQNKLRATYADVIGEIVLRSDPKQLFVGGKSMGGRVASYIAGDIPRVSGLIFLGYPLHPPGKPEQLRDAHLYDVNKPMLFVSGTRDALARRELLEAVIRRIGAMATLRWMEKGDHSLRAGKQGPDYLPVALGEIDTWIRSITA